ncbi:MAG: hypothetical protein DMG65_02320 [Candidatus Angelobacter sp. Gp1-AA117]|nr:MAG: hypothetical protein DMG65_02320 [Candidatus Angelobacter sp. Gp1-AA117]
MLDLRTLASVIPQNWRVICSSVAAGFGTAATVTRTVSSFLQAQSLGKKLRDEEARAVELVDVVKRLQGIEGEYGSAVRGHLEISLQTTLKKLSDLRKEAAESHRHDSNHDLSLLQRLFLCFRPEGERERLVHGFTYLFMSAGPLLIALMVYLWKRGSIRDNDTVADVIVLVCYGVLVFRSWALAERRWCRGYEPSPGLMRKLFLLIQPVNPQMRVAQVSMWCCFFWVVETLEDVIFHAVQGEFEMKDLLSFSLAIIGSVLCRMWTAEEWKHGHSGRERRTWELQYPDRMQSAVKRWLVRAAFCSMAVLPLPFLFRLFGGDIFDVTGASVIWLLSCLASSQWLYLARSAKQVRIVEPVKTMVRSAAS